MTIGTLNKSSLTVFAQYNNFVSGGYVFVSNVNIGLNYVKTWAGTDYSGPFPFLSSRRVWEQSNRITFSGRVPERKPRPKKVKQIGLDEHEVSDPVSSVSYRSDWVDKPSPPPSSIEGQHSYTMSLEVWSDGPIYYDVFTNSSKTVLTRKSARSFRGIFGTGYSPMPSSSWNANDDLKLIDKLKSAVAGSDFDMGVSLAESKEALDTIAKSAGRLFQAYQSLKKGRLGDVAHALGTDPRRLESSRKKALSARWLELQYGWLPLVQDSYDAAQFLAQTLNFPQQRTVRVRKNKPLVLSPVAVEIQNGGNYTFSGKTRAQILVIIKESNVSKLTGLVDPATIAWELTPWSFVADWFIPIGSYLSARGLASNLVGTFVTSKKTETRFVCSRVVIDPAATVTSQGVYKHMQINMTRTVSSSLFVPFPNIKPLGSVLSWKHCANAVALLVSSHGS